MSFNLPHLFQAPDTPSEPDDFNVVGDEIFATFSPWASWQSEGNPFAPTPMTLLPVGADSSFTMVTNSISMVPVTSGGITINVIYDAAAMAAPASFRAGIQQAVGIMAAAISDKITVNIKIDYSGTGGGAAAGPDHGIFQSYSSVRSNLINYATPGDTTFNALAAGSSIQGQANVAVWNAQLKLWGLMGANDTTTDDGSATFATDINSSLLVGVALHELTHAMGRIPYGPQPDIFDLYRFTSAGTRLFQGSASAPAAYFSLDGGNTKLADYGRTSDSSDFLNSGVQGPNDPFNEFYTAKTTQQLTTADLKQLDALGFHLMTADTVSPSLVQNASISVAVGGTAVISSSQLQFDDNVSTHAQETYTVVTGPTRGTLLKNGLAATSFTQGDVDNGLIAYHETASFASPDSITFKVTDAAGNATATAQFHINVLANLVFGQPTAELAAFAPGAGGWTDQNHFPRQVADVNGDGMADIIGFSGGGVNVALASGNGHFASPIDASGNFAFVNGWTSQDQFPRLLGDVNGDGKADIVAFAGGGVNVALASSGGHFAPAIDASGDFAFFHGWTSEDQFPRLLGDVNGDHMADIVGFAGGGVNVALATGNGHFAAAIDSSGAFAYINGWTSEDQFPRLLGDVNGDGMADIVGFAAGGVNVALATGNGHFAAPIDSSGSLGFNSGWTSQSQYPRLLADVNGDGMADIVGFGAQGVSVALATGNGHFAAPINDIASFGTNAGGWLSQDLYPRALGDVNGDGAADIIGFAQTGIYEALSNGFHLV